MGALRLQCRVPRVLPLPDQAVVCEQACVVLRAYGPWLPDGGPPMIPGDAGDAGDAVATCVGEVVVVHALVAGAPSCCLTAPSSSVHAPTLPRPAIWMQAA